ncbi:CD80-like immunoglobulin C2-set [Trinorchestia longiramus]|nr:CD80-like immunoglobulin C2-set [Trinorchestia longiramus]
MQQWHACVSTLTEGSGASHYHFTIVQLLSVDGRSSPLSMADHWQDPTTLGVRAKFSLDLNPPGLIINPVHLSDQGLYRCRVDFRSSRSWNKIIRLSIVEPPRSVRLYETGAPVTEGREGLAPHQEGDLVSLTCEVHGGIPYPTVSWWYRGVRITPAPTTREGDVTRSSIDLPRLSRNDLKAEVTCQASNTNSTAPLVVTELVNLTLPPLAVTLHGISTPLSEGVSTSVVCESVGSRPPATLTWWWNDAPLHRTSNLAPEVKTQNFDDGNVTRSTLVIAPQLSDEGASVTCGARNSHLNHSLMQDTGTITVHYIPRLQLKPGQSIDLEDIKEGADAYFECDIVANPRAFKVVWLHNGMELEHNVSAGVIQSNQSLVLQRLRRASSGEYICTATNARGTGLSEPVTLVVKFSPLTIRLTTHHPSHHSTAHKTKRVFRLNSSTQTVHNEIPDGLMKEFLRV